MELTQAGEDYRITTMPSVGGTPSNGSPLSFGPITLAARDKEFSMLIAGRSDGSLSSWKVTHKIGNSGGSPRETVLLTTEPHHGHITAMNYFKSPTFRTGHVLVSTSIDRTIKLWDCWADMTADPLLETLVGHGATVTAISDTGGGSLVSSSADGTIRLWRSHAPKAKLTCTQVLEIGQGLSSVGAVRSAAGACTLFAGANSGSVIVMREKRSAFEISHIWHVHTLAITAMIVVSAHNLIVSGSFDGEVNIPLFR